MIEMDTTTKSLCSMLDDASGHEERTVLIKYGSTEARVSMKIVSVELVQSGQVVIVVEA